jgi:large subunit ribosomal protein L25
MNSRQYIKLAESLPPRLTRFFARYPPQALLSQSALPSSSTPSTSSTVSDSTASPVEQIPTGQDGLAVPSPFRAQKHPVTGRWHDPVFSLRRQAELVKLARQHGVEELLPYTVKGTEERLRRRAENGLRVKGTGVGQRVKGKESERTLKGRYVLGIFLCYGDLDMQHQISWKRVFADDVISQIGEAQTSHVGDAADDTDVEGGKLIHRLQFPAVANHHMQRGHGRGWKKWPK